MDRLLIAQKIYDFSNPEIPKDTTEKISFEVPDYSLGISDIADVLRRYFNARCEIHQDGDEFTITYPKMHRQRMREVLNNIWNLVDKDAPKQSGKVNSETRSFGIDLPTGVDIDQIKRFLAEQNQHAFVLDQIGPKRYRVTTYQDKFVHIKQLVEFYLSGVAEKPRSVKVPSPNPKPEKRDKTPYFLVRVPVKYVDVRKLENFLATNMASEHLVKEIGDNLEISVFSSEGKSELDQVLRKFGLKRQASAYVQDIRIGDLPASVKKDLEPFVRGMKNSMCVIQYGMVVSELEKKVDPHNYQLAKAHVAEKSDKQIEKEFYEKSDNKYILIVNDRIVDGHHFLAKAQKIGASRTLKVLDLTPVRFQKRTAISLFPEREGYQITSLLPDNGDGQRIWIVEDDRGRYLTYRGQDFTIAWTAAQAESMLDDYLENPENYQWMEKTPAMKKISRRVHAKLLPEYQDVYVGIDEAKQAVEIITVTESPFTHEPRINLFMMDPETRSVSQIGHIDTADGHDSPTRLTVIDKQDILEEIQSLLAQLKSVRTVPYNEWHESADSLTDQLSSHD